MSGSAGFPVARSLQRVAQNDALESAEIQHQNLQACQIELGGFTKTVEELGKFSSKLLGEFAQHNDPGCALPTCVTYIPTVLALPSIPPLLSVGHSPIHAS